MAAGSGEHMKALAIIINIFFPGIGTLIVGKVGQGIAQILLYMLGVVLNFTVVGLIIGVPLCIAVWIWALVSTANAPSAPIEVVIRSEQLPPRSA
jgi:TM2 domain-containing membrane protein YozV